MQNIHLLGTSSSTQGNSSHLLHTARVEMWRQDYEQKSTDSVKRNKKLITTDLLQTNNDDVVVIKTTDLSNHDADQEDNNDDQVEEIQIEIPLEYVNKWHKSNKNNTATVQHQEQKAEEKQTHTYAHTMV